MTARVAAPYLLVVEDDVDVGEMLCAVIQEAGYLAVLAGDGREALDHLATHEPPFVVLLDLMMPNLDGRGFLAIQRGLPAIAHLPVVVLSADRRTDDAAFRGLLCLRKPIDLDRLIEAIEPHASAAGVPPSRGH